MRNMYQPNKSKDKDNKHEEEGKGNIETFGTIISLTKTWSEVSNLARLSVCVEIFDQYVCYKKAQL